MRVRRWRKYGLDRLYVTDAAGRRVGWVDLPTGRTTIERPELTDAFTAAVTAHRTEHPGTEHLPAVAPPAADGDLQVPNCSPDPGLAPRAPAEPAERDLVANLPGQAARALGGRRAPGAAEPKRPTRCLPRPSPGPQH